MVLRSLFLGTDDEVDWAFYRGPIIFKPQLIKDLNLILNNEANSNPIENLGKIIVEKVYAKFNVKLEWEVKIIGE